jgi:hypothetical protein
MTMPMGPKNGQKYGGEEENINGHNHFNRYFIGLFLSFLQALYPE